MEIRGEYETDHDAIYRLTEEAFAPMAFADGDEAEVVDNLRMSGDLTLSLLVEELGVTIGHVAFSPATIGSEPTGWFGLGPVSVAPCHQRRGIGKTMIQMGLDRLRSANARGCVLIGNPDIYSKVGFESDGKLRYRELSAKLVQRIVFKGDAPSGEVRFADALEATP